MLGQILEEAMYKKGTNPQDKVYHKVCKSGHIVF